MKKIRYGVKGMSCAVCVAHVEKTAKNLYKDYDITVSLLTNSITLTVDDSENENDVFLRLKKALKSAGYKLERLNSKTDIGESSYKKDIRKLIYSIAVTSVLMYVSMGHMIGLPLPDIISENPIIFSALQAILTIPVIIINFKFFKNGFFAILNKYPNMDSLVAIGSAASFIYGIFAVIMIITGTVNENYELIHKYAHDLYFESAAMILTLVSLGKTLEGRAKAKASSAIKKLSEMLPKNVSLIKNGEKITVPLGEIKVGDLIEVKEGEIIPVDGSVIEGSGIVDESALSGESIPVEKDIDSKVSAACTLKGGYIIIRAEKVGGDTALSKIIGMIEDAAASKAPISRIADKISAIFVPAVIIIALITALVWIILGETADNILKYSISVLVISCPCALGLATPTAIIVGTAMGAERGILIKSAEALENISSAKYFLTDKTGTLTEGKPKVTDVISCGCDEKEVLRAAYAVESMSNHPLASAICEISRSKGIELVKSVKFESSVGMGISADTEFGYFAVGKPEFLYFKGFSRENEGFIHSELKRLQNEGKTAVCVGADKNVIGIIGIADYLREDSVSAISELKKMGITTVMITGDNEATAKAISAQCGIDECYSRLLPEDKERIISEYSKKGITIMAGDGINDAPALTRADIGIAVGAGTEVAIDCADIVLTKNSISDAVDSIKLSSATMRCIKQNLFWALIYNTVCIPIAAGVLSFIGITITPMIASAAMSISSVCVVTNSLRLRRSRTFKNQR